MSRVVDASFLRGSCGRRDVKFVLTSPESTVGRTVSFRGRLREVDVTIRTRSGDVLLPDRGSGAFDRLFLLGLE